MLNHTKKIKEIYEDIQRRLYYMIPEKWEKLYLYSSVLDEPDKEGKTGELFFYYIPKGIFKKNPVNVYEIPSKFNLDETQYLKLVDILYQRIKELRNEFKKSGNPEIWSNITMSIYSLKFSVEYDYTDLVHADVSSYERHIIWRYEKLGISEAQVSKEEREILKRYLFGPKIMSRKEHYDTGIYIRDIENMVAYTTDNYEYNNEGQHEDEKPSEPRKNRNQILFNMKDKKKTE